MKIEKLYKCPFCDNKFSKQDLIDHVADKHDDMIPEKFSATRTVYDYLHMNKEYKCIICNKTTSWNEAKGKYNAICDSKKCKDTYISKFASLDFTDPKVQADLLAQRKISGTYKWSDGVEKTYSGKYELKCLEFMDKIMHINSEDIIAPGLTLEYVFEGKKHNYLTDFFYIPYNLIIEVKDGGDNPNRKEMVSYRKKVIAKEKYIIEKTNYNYIRLTDNDLTQLLAAFFELKMKYLDDDNKERVIRINE